MRHTERAGVILMLCLLTVAPMTGRAEGNLGGPRRAGDGNRVYGADFIKPVSGGLVTVGGSTLRWLPPGRRTWHALVTIAGHLSRLGLDDAGARVMAVWEKDERLHLVGLRDGGHATQPLPPLAATGSAEFLYVHSLAFTPDGMDALVFLAGPTRNANIASQAWRTALGGQDHPVKLWEDDGEGELVWTCGRGALCVLPTEQGRRNSVKADLTGRLAARIVEGAAYTDKTVYWNPANKFRWARVAAGSTADRLITIMETGRGGNGIVRYHWGDDGGTYQDLPPGPGPSGGVTLADRSDELLYVIDRGRELEIVRRALPPASASSSVPLWSPMTPVRIRGGERTLASRIFAKGFRSDGSIWLHLGDDLALIGTDGRVRRVDLRKFVGGHPEWAGSAVYLERPESLWIGIEVGSGRDWIRLDFAGMERKATPWPARRNLPPVGAQQDGDMERMTKCLPPDALIATPDGDVPVNRLEIGMPVWTRNTNGDRIAGRVIRTSRSPAPAGHRMVRLVLADGRTLTVSPGHPLPDGRTADSLMSENSFDGSKIRSAGTLRYAGTETFDLLPSGDTGIYWANGLPLASTLSESRSD